MDEGYETYRMMLRDLFPEYDTKRVFVVNGSPGSGKSTFVKSKIRQGDIALDFDKLTAALALDDALYGDRKPQLDVALAAREAINEQIQYRRGDWENAYVITASNDPEKVRLAPSYAYYQEFRSTPPAEGLTAIALMRLYSINRISIHAPCGGGDSGIIPIIIDIGYFNPRPLRRGRR